MPRNEGNETRLDFWSKANRGLIKGMLPPVHKFGRNDAVTNGTWAFVNLLGFTAWPLSAVTTVRIKAGGNAADTAAGVGAQSVFVQGIAADLTEQTVEIVTAGASASAVTTLTFWRIHKAWVGPVGAYGVANTGIITIENGGGGTDLIKIAAGEGQSQFAGFTIQDGYYGELASAFFTVDALKAADMKIMTRANITDVTTPYSPKRLKLYFDGVLGAFSYKPVVPEFIMDPLTDIWVEAKGDGAQTEVSANMEILLTKI